jgi:transcriptional regulator with XRE-family HTH domain
MDNRGYASRIVRANLEADMKSPGVKLGRFCIKNEYPVREVAEYFGVSRMTIYKWFTGEWIPRKGHEAKISEMLKRVGVV